MKESSLLERIDKRVKIIPLNYKGKFHLLGALSRLRKIIIENDISLVHTHLNPSDIYTRLILPRKVKQVHTMHTTYSMDNTTRPVNLFLEKYVFLKRKDCNLIFLSSYNQEDFLKAMKFKGRSFVLNNFIADDYFGNTTAIYPPDATALKMVAVGALRDEKNYGYLLDVFSLLKNYDVSLDIYGGGDKTQYEKVIEEKQLKVRLMGQHDQVHKAFNKYNLFILPSRFEGFGLSIFEAMVSGVPVMISNLDSLKSIVEDHAIYFDLDDPKKVAETIIAILHHKVDINTMAEKAKQFAEKKVRRGVYINNLLKIYNEVIQDT